MFLKITGETVLTLAFSPPPAVYYPAREGFVHLYSDVCDVAVLLRGLTLITDDYLERHQNDSSLLLSFCVHFLLAGTFLH